MRQIILRPPPPTGNRYFYGHWRSISRHHQSIHSQVELLLREAGERLQDPLEHAFFEFRRYSCMMPDYGGLVWSCKAVLDGFVRANYIRDDSPRHVAERYEWIHSKHRKDERLEVDFCPIDRKTLHSLVYLEKDHLLRSHQIADAGP